MPETVEDAAHLLAQHALVLLALGASIVLAAVLGVAALIRAFEPIGRALAVQWQRLLPLARRHPAARGILGRMRGAFVGGYVLLQLTLGLAAVTAVSAFVVVAEEVGAPGAVAAFDLAFAQALRDGSTRGWRDFFSAISWFGSSPVLAIATLAAAPLVWGRGGPPAAIAWLAAQAGGGVLNWTLKQTFARTRPEFADPALAGSWSFPSGHAMATFVFCGVGAYLLWRYTRSWFAGIAVLALSALWCLLMAFSRLYLGVHFASDVLAGLIAGAAWVAVCISALESIHRRTIGHLNESGART